MLADRGKFVTCLLGVAFSVVLINLQGGLLLGMIGKASLLVDYGKADIWRSVPDSLASMANYLRQQGWQPAAGWGLEAVVPANVPCTLEGPDQGKRAADWAGLRAKSARLARAAIWVALKLSSTVSLRPAI